MEPKTDTPGRAIMENFFESLSATEISRKYRAVQAEYSSQIAHPAFFFWLFPDLQ